MNWYAFAGVLLGCAVVFGGMFGVAYLAIKAEDKWGEGAGTFVALICIVLAGATFAGLVA